MSSWEKVYRGELAVDRHNPVRLADNNFRWSPRPLSIRLTPNNTVVTLSMNSVSEDATMVVRSCRIGDLIRKLSEQRDPTAMSLTQKVDVSRSVVVSSEKQGPENRKIENITPS